MKTIEIIGFKRANLGKTDAKKLREEAKVPCVLYGGKEQVHFNTPMFLFRDLVYTQDVHQVDLNIEGKKYAAILQDVQFHPVSEIILHADFLELSADKKIKMDIPVTFVGTSPGVLKGGKLVQKLKRIKVEAIPANMPDYIEVDISGIELGKSFKIGELKPAKYTVLNPKNVTIASVETSRASKTEEPAAGTGGIASAVTAPAAGDKDKPAAK